MVAARLRAPDKLLSTSTILKSVPLPVPELVRISGFASGEPFFGVSGGNRFDAPGCLVKAPEYSSCYLGLSFDVALAESLLDNPLQVDGFLYVSRHLPNGKAVVLFDRAKGNLSPTAKAQPLYHSSELMDAVRNFRIDVR